ncbi:hypothetical protein [Yersinia enterocolitica]
MNASVRQYGLRQANGLLRGNPAASGTFTQWPTLLVEKAGEISNKTAN